MNFRRALLIALPCVLVGALFSPLVKMPVVAAAQAPGCPAPALNQFTPLSTTEWPPATYLEDPQANYVWNPSSGIVAGEGYKRNRTPVGGQYTWTDPVDVAGVTISARRSTGFADLRVYLRDVEGAWQMYGYKIVSSDVYTTYSFNTAFSGATGIAIILYSEYEHFLNGITVSCAEPPEGACLSYNFLGDDQGWTALTYTGGQAYGQYTAGSGWTDNYPGTSQDGMYIQSPPLYGGPLFVSRVVLFWSPDWPNTGGQKIYVRDDTDASYAISSASGSTISIDVSSSQQMSNLRIIADSQDGGQGDITSYLTRIDVFCEDEGEGTEVCLDFDFTADSHGFVPVPAGDGFTAPVGSYTAGTGWVSTSTGDGSGAALRAVMIQKDLGGDKDIVQVIVDYTASPGGAPQHNIYVQDGSGSTISTVSSTPGTVNNGAGQHQLSEALTARSLRIYGRADLSHSAYGSYTIRRVRVICPSTSPGNDDWAYPIKTSDREPDFPDIYPMATPFDLRPYGRNDRSSLILYSLDPGAYVHAAASGTVESVQRLAVSCVNHPAGIYLPEPGWCVMRDGGFKIAEMPLRVLHGEHLYVVRIRFGDYEVTYLVEAPMVSQGQPVTAGCIIGVTADLGEDYSGLGLSDNSVTHSGFTIVQASDAGSGAAVDVIDRFQVDPEDKRCGAEDDTDGCKLVADPEFKEEQKYWSVDSSPGKPGEIPGFELGGGLRPTGIAYQSLSLDATIAYAIRVRYTPDPALESIGRASFTVRVSDTVAQEVAYTGGSGQQTVDIPARTYQTGYAVYYLEIEGGENRDFFRVDSICLYNPADGIPPEDGGCIVRDPNLDDPSAWGPNANIQEGVSFLVMSSDRLQQAVKLFPKTLGGDVQNYKVTIIYRLNGSVTGSAGLVLQYGQEIREVPPATSYDWESHDVTFPVSVASDELLTINAEQGKAAQIDWLCIRTTEGDGPPGYDKDPRPIQPSCKKCAFVPIGNLGQDLKELVGWLSCWFGGLWTCQAKTILLGIWQAAVNILTFLGFTRMWLAETIAQAVLWTNGNIRVFSMWLDSLLQNMFSGLIRFFQDGEWNIGGGGDNIWTFLTSAITGFFNLMGELVRLIGTLITLIVTALQSVLANLAGTVMSVIVSLLNGVSQAPAPPPPDWLPNCSDPNAPLYSLCPALYLIDNELTTGTGSGLIPAIVGLTGLSFLLWTAEKFLGVFGGGSSDDDD